MAGLVLWLCLVFLLNVSCSGQNLECFHCELGFWDMCSTTKVNCSAGEQCYTGIGVAASVLKVKMMGCLAEADCNKTTVLTFPANKTLYKVTKHCCDENYCNGSPDVLMVSSTLIALVASQIVCNLII